MSQGVTRRAALGASAGALLAPTVRAQSFPSRPVKMLVGFAAGGAADALARVYAQRMQQLMGVPVIIDNRPGAGQVLAIRGLVASPPDGYTVLMATGSGLAQGPGVRNDLPYDPLKDFSLIGLVATAPGVFFVSPQLPARTMADFVAYATANPGRLNYGSAGVGSANHLQTEYFKQATGTDLVHVPYRSDQEVAREVMGGAVQFGLTVAQPAIPLVQAGNLRGLAVTGDTRLPALPDLPSLAETGIPALRGIASYTFYGLVGPAGMPQPLIDQFNAVINAVSTAPDIVGHMKETLFFDPVAGTPASFRRYLEEEIPKWREVGKSLTLPS